MPVQKSAERIVPYEISCEILGFRGNKYENYYLLVRDNVHSGINIANFWRNLPPPSSMCPHGDSSIFETLDSFYRLQASLHRRP
jgi:hypothetical protein